MKVTPALLEVVLHYYTTPGDFGVSRLAGYDMKGARHHMDELLAAGMLEHSPDPGAALRATERLRVWVEEGILCVPLPVLEQRWRFPS